MWNSRSAASWAVCAASPSGSASTSSPASSAILPLIFGQPGVEQRHDVRLLRALAPAPGDHVGDARDDHAPADRAGRRPRPARRVVAPTRAVEAGRRAGVAGRPLGIDEVEDHVAVAVEAHLAHRQRVARRSRPCSTSALRERLQKCADAGRQRRASASRFAQANMRTIPVRASCAITGTSPSRVEGHGAPSSGVWLAWRDVACTRISHRDAARAQVIVRLARR